MQAIEKAKLTYNTTRFPTLFYAKLGSNFWSFFVKDEADTHYAKVGPQYSTKAELLGDLTRYAIEYGLEPYPVLKEVAPGIYRAAQKAKLTARDFTYVYEPGIGQTYQNGPYIIGVGRASYACNYRGQCFSWGHEDFLSAIEACAKHDAARRARTNNQVGLAN